MSFPKVLKNYLLNIEGRPYMGRIEEFTLPNLTRKLEEYRGGGMIGPVEIEMGMDALEASFVAGGSAHDILKAFAENTIDGVKMRLSAAMQRDDLGLVDAVAYHIHGRMKEGELGTLKSGDVNKTNFTLAVSYYKIVENGVTILEYDPLNMIFNVGGKDLMAAQRAALGLAAYVL